MFCGNCGNSREEKEKFCSECGKPFQKSIIFNPSIEKEVKNDFAKPNIPTRKPKKFKFLVAAFSIVVVLLLSSLLVYMFIERPVKNGKRTLMIYMVGSDLESKNGLASADIHELIGNDIDYDKVNILLYTGGSKKWHIDTIPTNKHAIFKVEKDGINKIDEFEGNNDMTKPDNLTVFLNYGYRNYKAEKYSLILWNHGIGIFGYGVDEISKKNMTLNQLSRALRQSKFGTRNKLEFIGFDACIMSGVEIANIVKDYADYLISSQENEPGFGWDYTFITKMKIDTPTSEMSKHIIDGYFNYNKKYGFRGNTLSLIDLSKIDGVKESINTLFSKVDSNLKTDYAQISRNRSNAKDFGVGTEEGEYYDLVDIKNLIKNFPEKYKNEVEKLNKAIDGAVIYQQTDLNHANGLSIYFPYKANNEIHESNLFTYKLVNYSKEYNRFVNNFSDIRYGDRKSNWRTFQKPIYKDDDTIAIDVESEVIENYSNLGYLIFEKTDEKYYTPIYKGSDVRVDGNTISTKIENKALKVTNSKSSMYLTAFETSMGTDYTKYKIPVMLQKVNEDFSIEVVSGFLEYIIDDNNPEGYISTVVPLPINNIPSKTNLDYKEYDYINFINYKYNVKDENNNYLEQWEASKEVVMFEVNAKEDFKLGFSKFDPNKDYTAVFRIKDSQGNVTNSEFVDIKGM